MVEKLLRVIILMCLMSVAVCVGLMMLKGLTSFGLLGVIAIILIGVWVIFIISSEDEE